MESMNWETLLINWKWLLVGLAFVLTWLRQRYVTGKLRDEFDEAIAASESLGAEIEDFFGAIREAGADGTFSADELTKIKDEAFEMIGAGKAATDEWTDFVLEVYRKITGKE